ncbi:kinase/pyrophosphorylase [Nocardioides flavus (ex Wang et al. 2016)]|uniref:kinase/pyrophosphorylase n=1 Tax=Nocardioides flavus (ex Wang et al. 2016) TaxID=2058780 RepID=UPI0038B304DF
MPTTRTTDQSPTWCRRSFLSDRTGTSTQTMGHALLIQFSGVPFDRTMTSFVSTAQKTRTAYHA